MKALLTVAAVFAVAFSASAQQHQAVTATTVTNATGTVAQYNYDESGGTVVSLLLKGNVVLTFAGPVCNGIGSLATAGNAVTYSGTGITFSSGFQAVAVTSFTNTTTKATWTQPTVVKPSAYAATVGVISQLNYGNDGTVNGFLFTPKGATKALFVDTGRPSSTLAPLLTVGAAVTVTGTVDVPPVCAAAPSVTEVDATSLVFGTTTVTLNGEGGFGGPGGH